MLVVVHYFGPHIGGMEEVARAQAASLARRGHRVTVLTCGHDPRLARHEVVDGFEVKRCRALNFVERRLGVTFPLIGLIGAARVAHAVAKADIVHVHDVFYPTSQIAFVAARILRRRVFLTQHVALVDHPSRLVMAVQRAMYATAGRTMVRDVEACVAYNVRVRDLLTGLGAPVERVLLKHNGVDASHFSPAGESIRHDLRARYGLPGGKPVALFVGRLVPKKGYDLVIEAACDRYTTLIVGDWPTVTLPPSAGVVIYGPAGRAELSEIYRMSDVFVLPAQGEMFTLAMQEAMACGLPVVTTDDPAYGNYGLDRDMIRFVPRQAPDIRAAVLDIIDSRDRAEAMGRYSRRLAEERFSWEANYDREYALYRPRDPAALEVPLVPSVAG